ncbi:hypothetical protein RW1_038_00990 [Rhodococcus wratislaviensis NBRC 100605]|uniref:Uncharacterized protein n=1 Tax=Rhodococcus wratislaviensis NBRC 100605 TaxID=1219028 RepID=X0Q701_RHOWR|nr:hypothetical protein RW1_038_00990 [Rhodococcus wratislaviensis NBRC 100605]
MQKGHGETRAVVQVHGCGRPAPRQGDAAALSTSALVHDKEWLMQNIVTGFAPPPDTAGQLSDIELAVVLAVLTGDSTPLLQLSGSTRHR